MENITFCNTVGLRGVFVLLLVLGTATLHFVALYVYTVRFTYMQREGIWLFFFFFILFSLLLIYLLISWKRLTRNWVRRNYAKNNMIRRTNNNPMRNFAQIYSKNFGVEKGKFFLWRLYLFEFIENWIQLYNMQTIYLCTLPLGWTICFSIILISESSYRAYNMAKRIWFSNVKRITVIDKNIQYGLDVVVDLFFLVIPLSIIVLGYDVWITVGETTWILFSPSLSLFGKLRRLMIESTNQYAEAMLIRNRDIYAQETTKKLKKTTSRQQTYQ